MLFTKILEIKMLLKRFICSTYNNMFVILSKFIWFLSIEYTLILHCEKTHSIKFLIIPVRSIILKTFSNKPFDRLRDLLSQNLWFRSTDRLHCSKVKPET